jgi:hypothetical protein
VKYIPKGQIQARVSRFHVGTPDADVAACIEALAKGPGWTPAKVREAVRYALKCHAKNRELFCKVMSGLI